MSDVFALALIPYRRGGVVESVEELDKEHSPFRTVNGGRLSNLRSGWKVFYAWTGNKMALIPPKSQKKSMRIGTWHGSGLTEKAVWNRGRDWTGMRMSLDLSKKNREALLASGLKFFRAVQIGARDFICEEVE